VPVRSQTSAARSSAASLPLNRVIQGDCVKNLAKLPKGGVDLVFADPPFNIGFRYDVYDDRREYDEYVKWSRDWIKAVRRVLKENGTFWLAIGDEFAAELKIEAQKAGFQCRTWVVWYYTFGMNVVKGFTRSHTHLFHFVKDLDRFTFNADNPMVRIPSARQLVYADDRANPKGRLPDNTWIYRPQDAPYSFRPDHDCWYFSRVAGTFNERQGFHGCQMPEQLMARIIRVSSNPNEVVLDPFAGSGATLAVAKKLGRQFLGFELSKEYVANIERRLKKVKMGDLIVGPENPAESSPATNRGRKLSSYRRRTGTLSVDKKTEDELVRCFLATAQGYSADFLLCDPKKNEEFVSKCKKAGIKGYPATYNQLLLRLRKAGRLPKASHRTERMVSNIDDYLACASEIAISLLEIDYNSSLDEILCSPDLAANLDYLAGRFAPGYVSFDYRWSALRVRKRATRARSQVTRQLLDKIGATPTFLPLDRAFKRTSDHSGIFLWKQGRQHLYLGESDDVIETVSQIVKSTSWGPSSVEPFVVLRRTILEKADVGNSRERRNALRSALLLTVRPQFNLSSLFPKEQTGV